VIPNRCRLLAAIPPIHPSTVKLLRLADGPSQDLAHIVALLRGGAVSAADLTRAANSPLFETRYEIRDPLQALVYLGLERIKALVATTAIRDLAHAAHSGLKYVYWRHNLATALICQKLSASVKLPSERCYIAGLIHDAGRLVLLAVFPEYERFGLLADPRKEDLLATERRLFGWTHTEAGRWLLAQWGFPIEMQNVAAFHEDPAAAPNCDRAVIGLARASSHIADLIGMSAFPTVRDGQLREIAVNLSEIAGEGLSVDLADIMEWVVTRVNGIELSLC
jgi:HD-like signal output (HDOD) protein